ncbi:MAG: hypothetical protein Aureis2KO_17910 [Aureisphaera sp.]
MRKFVFTLSVCIGSIFGVFGQTVTATQEVLEGYRNIPQEEIYVHYNTNLLFAGEYLYYKVYCKNSTTQKLSTLSKVSYVELVASDGRSVFKHKVRLHNGKGQGDFFLPVGTPSGSYKLIAYTQWMRNSGEKVFFNGDVAIINPYQNAQESILLSETNEGEPQRIITNNTQENLIANNSGIRTNKTLFAPRERVVVTLNNQSMDLTGGTYSISVKKRDFNVPFAKVNSQNYKKRPSKQVTPRLGETLYLPELRGEVVWGNVVDKTNKGPIANAKVALSIPGQDFVTKIANTNEKGVFYFILQEEFNDEKATFQVLGDTASDYSIEVKEHTSINYDGLEFQPFYIDANLEESIVKRSVYNQIENGYYELKPDTVKLPVASKPFYGKRGTSYDLDDYKRFSTVKETFLEFIDDAWTKNVNGETVFSVRSYENTLVSDFPPLIIIDGIVLQDQQQLVDYPSRKIKTIGIVRDKYYLGADVFQGVIIVETIEGDFYDTLRGDYVAKINLFTPQSKKSYFAQQYGKDGNDRIPDFRSQLLWEPNAEVTSEGDQWHFYTSDNTGTYEISFEGFTENGLPVSLKKTIEVK